MTLQLFVGLLTLVAFFMPITRRQKRFWPLLLLLGVSFLTYSFADNFQFIKSHYNSFNWLSYQNLKIKFAISSSPHLLHCLYYLLAMLIPFLFLNTLNKQENTPLTSGNLMVLLVVSFILMYSSTNYIQLMVGSCCFSILGFYLINDNTTKSKFIFFNFAAEIATFTALAIIYAKTQSIELSLPHKYTILPWHKNFAAILILFSCFTKCGMFLFHSHLVELKLLDFNRFFACLFIGYPLSGLLLFNKLNYILASSNIVYQVLVTILSATVFLSLFGMFWHNNIKSKIIYLSMLFYTYSLYRLWNSPSDFTQIISLMPLILIISWSLMLACLSSGETLVFNMGIDIKQQKWNFCLSLTSIFCFCFIILQQNSSILSYIYVFLSLLGLAPIIRSIYLKSNNDNSKTSPLNNTALILSFPLLIGNIIYISLINQWQNWSAYASYTIFIGLMLIIPLKLYNYFANNLVVQEYDWLNTLYYTFIIAPIRLLGRILWLTVDFLVIERSIIGSISVLFTKCAQYLQKVQNTSLLSWGIMFLIGLAILLINLGFFAYE